MSTLLLLLTLCAHAAPAPLEAAVIGAAVSPTDPFSRLRLGQALARTEGREDEAVATLVPLLSDERHAYAAAESLAVVILSRPPRSPWLDAVDGVLAHPDFADSQRLLAWQARARARESAQIGTALLATDALLARFPDDVEVLTARAEVLLRADRPEAALVVIRDREDAALVSLKAASMVGAEQFDAARALVGEDALQGCRSLASPVPCAQYVDRLGLRALAEGILTRSLDAGEMTAPEESGVLYWRGVYLSNNGDVGAATVAWRQALDADPDNNEARQALALALLDGGKPGAAQAIVSADSDLISTIYAVQLVEGKPSLEQITRARELAPDHPRVLIAAAEVYTSSRKWGDAIRSVEFLLASDPADRAVIGLAIDVGLAARREDVAVGAVRGGLAATDSYEDWRALSGDLANLLAALGEALKDDDDLDEATANYLVAYAMLPTDVDLMLGLSGVLWDSDRLDAAEDVLRQAATYPEAGLTPTLLLVELLHAQERTEEARALLRQSGLSDARAQELERKLTAALQTPEEALTAYEAMIADDPGDPLLHHELGNTLMTLKRYDEALAAYQRSRELDPESPWSALGQINALLSLGEVAQAEAALRDFPANRKPKVLYEKSRIERRLLQARADELRELRRDRDAFAIYEVLLSASKRDTWALTGLAELYMLHQQYGVAKVFFEEAVEVDPLNEAAWGGLVRVHIALGAYEDAEALLTELASREIASEDITTLRSALRLRKTIDAAERAWHAGDPIQALALIEAELALRPYHPDLMATWARIQADRDPEAAIAAATAVLTYQDPYHEGALGALVAAAWAMDDPEAAIPLLDAAIGGPVGDWVRWARDSVGLQADLLEVTALLEERGHRAAVARLEAIEALHLSEPNADLTRQRSELEEVRRRQLIGGMWLTLGQPERALPHYEEARALDPRDPDTLIGLAGTLEAMGLTGRATQLLNQHWEIYHDPKTGEALIQLQARRGRHNAAGDVAAEVARQRFAPINRDSLATEPLPVAELPEGREVEIDATPGAWRLLTAEELEALYVAADDPNPIDAELGFGWVWRPNADDPATELQALLLPVGAEFAPIDPVRFLVEAMPVNVTGDGDTHRGASFSVGAATPWAGSPVALRGLLGLTPVGFEAGSTWTGLGMLNVRPVRGMEARFSATRAPVPQSVLSWAGEKDDNGDYYGRVTDSWLTLLATTYTSQGAEAGIAGRWGGLDGLQIAEAVRWRQLQGWGSATAWSRGEVDIRLGLDAQLLSHDAWIGGFEPGQGGVFTPELYFAGVGQGEIYWMLPQNSAAFCAGADIGPQYISGIPGVEASWRPGSQLNASARLSPVENWHIMLGFSQQSVWSGWQQNTALLQVRYGDRASKAYTPSETTSSAVHGLPFQEPGSCWDRVAQ